MNCSINKIIYQDIERELHFVCASLVEYLLLSSLLSLSSALMDGFCWDHVGKDSSS